MLGFTLKTLSLSCFEIPETVVKDKIAKHSIFVEQRGLLFETTGPRTWVGYFLQGMDHNNSFPSVKCMTPGNVQFHFAAPLFFLKLILSQALTALIGVALVLAFTLFFVCEQYESEIDGLAKLLFNGFISASGSLRRNLPASMQLYLEKHGILHHDKGIKLCIEWERLVT
ncbi:hypothetical protein ACFX2I_013264 [Malus domestica]